MPILAGQTLTADLLNHLRPTTYYAAASAPLAGAASDTDLTDCTITLTTETDDALVVVDGVASYNWTANTAVTTVECWQDTTPLSGKIICDPDNTTGRVTAAQQWRVNPGPAGSYTFKIVGESIPANMTIDATHTTIKATVYEVD